MSRDDRYDPPPLRALRPPFIPYPIEAHEAYSTAHVPLAHDIISSYPRERPLSDFASAADHVDSVQPGHHLPSENQPQPSPQAPETSDHRASTLSHSLPISDHPNPSISHTIPHGVSVAEGSATHPNLRSEHNGHAHHNLAISPDITHHSSIPAQNHTHHSTLENTLAAEHPSFGSLISSVARHPSLVLLLKRTFAVMGMHPFDSDPHLREVLSASERNSASVRHSAEMSGLTRAASQFSSVDVFLSAVLAALADLRPGFPPADNPTLRHALTIASNTHVHSARQHSVWRDDRQIQKTVSSGRTPLSEKAKAALERWFQENLENPYPTVGQKLELARICSMSLNSVNNWFGNKRMRIKRKMLNVANGPFDGSSISDKVLAPRSKWNAVVVSKMNSLAGREVVASATGRATGFRGSDGFMSSSGVRTVSDHPSGSVQLPENRVQSSPLTQSRMENI